MALLARHLVSKKKRRFQEHGFDLDLSYITDRIIAMGWPSQKWEKMYRNPMSEVKRFLELKHAGHYKVWNLCAEREYDISNFHDRVERILLYDHMAPPFELMSTFCKSVDEWMKADPLNIAVVHCKAGKGRTGVMICCYLVYGGIYSDTQTALDFYGRQRTFNGQGVTIPSQRRYVNYFCLSFQKYNLKIPHEGQQLRVRTVVIVSPPSSIHDLALTIYKIDGSTIYQSDTEPVYDAQKDELHIKLSEEELVLCGDYKFAFTKAQKKLFHFWFNTGFIEDLSLVLSRTEVDGTHKKKNLKKFTEKFGIRVFFTAPSGSAVAVPPQLPNATASCVPCHAIPGEENDDEYEETDEEEEENSDAPEAKLKEKQREKDGFDSDREKKDKKKGTVTRYNEEKRGRKNELKEEDRNLRGVRKASSRDSSLNRSKTSEVINSADKPKGGSAAETTSANNHNSSRRSTFTEKPKKSTSSRPVSLMNKEYSSINTIPSAISSSSSTSRVPKSSTAASSATPVTKRSSSQANKKNSLNRVQSNIDVTSLPSHSLLNDKPNNKNAPPAGGSFVDTKSQSLSKSISQKNVAF